MQQPNKFHQQPPRTHNACTCQILAQSQICGYIEWKYLHTEP